LTKRLPKHDPSRMEIHPTPTPRVKKTIERAGQEAMSRGHDYLGTEHLLLALLSDPDGVAGRVLRQLGVAELAAQRVQKIMESPGYSRWQLPQSYG
jgi:ATP-dependent Clp protease ATP-binding subunit ClpC